MLGALTGHRLIKIDRHADDGKPAKAVKRRLVTLGASRGDRILVTSGLNGGEEIVTAGLWQPIGFLSGGNQQKAILARWLLSNAHVFIFDEPTKGVDIGAKQQIYELMVELAKEGKGILMVSSDMPELISVSDRIVVMREGRLVTTVKSNTVTEHELLGYFLGTC